LSGELGAVLTMQNLDSEAVVRTEGLGRRFGRHWALAHVDLNVRQGEAVLLAGHNGSGKTTLLRCISGLYRPSAGTVSVLGHDPRKEIITCRRAMTLVSHHAFLYDRMTAIEILRFWADQAGTHLSKSESDEMLSEVNLENFAQQQVGGFSAGMRKRLTLLRTRIEKPQLVLWDEPFSSLDPAGRRLLAQWVVEFRERGITLMLATHALDVGVELCTRAVVLSAGQVVWKGPTSGVVEKMEAPL
jgi:heme exporter protein A